MRKLNIREKRILTALTKISFSETELFSYFLQHHYFLEKSNKALLIFQKFEKAFLYVRYDKFEDLSSRKQELGEFFEMLSLIIYLKEMRYITIYQVPQPTAELQIMKADFNKGHSDDKNIYLNDSHYIPIDDSSKIYVEDKIAYQAIELSQEVYDILIANFFGVLYVSEELREFVKNGFQTKDDLRFKKQQIIAWTGIGISLLLGILSLFISVCF